METNNLNFKKINEFFFKIENKLDLFNKNIDGIYFWEIIRNIVIQEILIEKKIIKIPHKIINNNLLFIIKKLYLIFYKLFFRNPYFGKKEEIYIIGHKRRININGYNTDIYTKYIKEELKLNNLDYQDFEPFAIDFMGNKDFESNNLLYLDYFNLFSFLGKKIYKLPNKDLQYIKELEYKINKTFSTNINIFNIIKTEISSFKIYYKHVIKFLKIKKPSIIINVVGYSTLYKAINKAAKQLNISTIELQHGVIDKYHLGYSMGHKKNIQTKYFTDYIFTWGNYWNKACNHPKNIKLISTGFPFFEEKKNNLKLNQKEKNILVISQGAIGEKLAKEIFLLAKNLPNFNFYYKLHPGEFHKINNEFKYLKKQANIKIILGEKNVYDLFAICKTQIGVFSTALFEGLGFNLKTIVFDLPGVEYMDQLVNEKLVFKVKNYIKCKNIILNEEKSSNFNSEYFLKNNSLNNIVNKIKEITK